MATVNERTRAETANLGAQSSVLKQDAILREAQSVHELKKMGLTDAEIDRVKTGLALTRAQTELTSSTAKSAAIEANLDKSLRAPERAIAMAQGGTSAIRNLNPVSGLFSKK